MKIAIVKLSALGDIIHAMVALQFIKKHIPNAQIDWIVEKGFKPILENNPDINKIHTIELKKAKSKKSIFLLIRELLKFRKLSKYDIVIDAQGLIKSAIVAKLIPSKVVHGYDKNSIRETLASKFYNSKTNIAYDKNTIERNLAVICDPFSVKVSRDEIFNKKQFLFYTGETNIYKTPFVVFVIGSTWPSRNYPKEKFAELANKLKIKCYVPWGNNNEKNDAEYISKKSNFVEVLPKLNLNDLKLIIDKSSLLVGNDTGPTHMAWGLNIPSITIFGPTPISRVYQTPINKVIKSSSEVDHFKLNKKDDSIKNIKATDIVKIAKELLNRDSK